MISCFYFRYPFWFFRNTSTTHLFYWGGGQSPLYMGVYGSCFCFHNLITSIDGKGNKIGSKNWSESMSIKPGWQLLPSLIHSFIYSLLLVCVFLWVNDDADGWDCPQEGQEASKAAVRSNCLDDSNIRLVDGNVTPCAQQLAIWCTVVVCNQYFPFFASWSLCRVFVEFVFWLSSTINWSQPKAALVHNLYIALLIVGWKTEPVIVR